MHFDRFKSCRRRCKSLEKYLEENADALERLSNFVKLRAEKIDRDEELISEGLPSYQSGKQLPDKSVACEFCDFVAKTPRGLQMHMKRSHRKTKKPGK